MYVYIYMYIYKCTYIYTHTPEWCLCLLRFCMNLVLYLYARCHQQIFKGEGLKCVMKVCCLRFCI